MFKRSRNAGSVLTPAPRVNRANYRRRPRRILLAEQPDRQPFRIDYQARFESHSSLYFYTDTHNVPLVHKSIQIEGTSLVLLVLSLDKARGEYQVQLWQGDTLIPSGEVAVGRSCNVNPFVDLRPASRITLSPVLLLIINNLMVEVVQSLPLPENAHPNHDTNDYDGDIETQADAASALRCHVNHARTVEPFEQNNSSDDLRANSLIDQAPEVPSPDYEDVALTTDPNDMLAGLLSSPEEDGLDSEDDYDGDTEMGFLPYPRM